MDWLDVQYRLERTFDIELHCNEVAGAGTPGDLAKLVTDKLQGRSLPVVDIPKLYVQLQKTATEVSGRRSWWANLSPWKTLDDLFPMDSRDRMWNELEIRLGFPLPPREFGKQPLFDVIRWLIKHHPERLPHLPAQAKSKTNRTSSANWNSESIWQGVVDAICDAVGVKASQVTPDASLQHDLGMEV